MDRQRWWLWGLIAFIICQVIVASLGLEPLLGIAAPATVMVSLILRFGLTFVVGTFLYAYLQLGWGWQFSVLFSAPSLLLLLPKMLPDLMEVQAWWRQKLHSLSEPE